MDKRKPITLKSGLKTYRVALYEVLDSKAELLDLLEFDAKSTKNIFRTLDRRLQRQALSSIGRGKMKQLLNLRCAICDKVKLSNQAVEELWDAEADEICPACFICDECDADSKPEMKP